MRVAAKWAIRIVLGTVSLAVTGWLVLYASQWQCRWRAERLFADVNAMQVRQSSWADFQRFQARWGAWGDYNGRCEPPRCYYHVLIGGLISKLPYPDSVDVPLFRLRKVLDAIGLRDTGATAGMLIEDGFVQSKFYSLSSFSYQTGELDDIVAEGPRLDGYENNYLHTDHDIRQIKGYMFDALMTPFEERQEREKLMRVRFVCLTSLRPCSSHREMLPDAYAEFEQEKNLPSSALWPHCHIPVWLLARDANALVLGEVLQAKHVDDASPDQYSYWEVQLRIQNVLKGKPAATLKEIEVEVEVYDGQLPPNSIHQFPYRTLLAAGRFTRPENENFLGSFDQSPCGIAEGSNANVKEAMRGIAADYAPERPDLY